MNKTKILLTFFLCLLILFSLSGCWSSQEINNLAIINVLGIDKNEKGDVVLTVSVIKPNNIFPEVSSIREDKQDSFLIETATGKTLFDAMGKLSEAISEKIYLGHVNAIVFGERAAQEEMESSLDFLKRENEFRPSMLLFVTKGLAQNVLKVAPTLNPTQATEMNELFKSNKFSAMKTVKDLSKFTEAMTSNTMDPVTGVINVVMNLNVTDKNKKQKKFNTSVKSFYQAKGENKVLRLKDTAVFKGSKLVGYLNESETKGLLWIQGDMEDSNMVLQCGYQSDDGFVSFRIRKSSSSMIPSKDNRKMTVKIKADADIEEVTCKNLNLNSNQIEYLNNRFREKIEEEVVQTLVLAQKNWETDIFGFGQAIYRKNPSKWDELAPSWRNGGLKDLEVVLNIEANVSRYGLTSEPSKANESR